MLSAAADLLTTCGGASAAHHLMQELSTLIRSLGNIDEFKEMLRQLKILLDGVGGAGNLARILSDLMKLISGIGGVDALLESLLKARQRQPEGFSQEYKDVGSCTPSLSLSLFSAPCIRPYGLVGCSLWHYSERSLALRQ